MASLGADQLSFGTTEPSNSSIVALILSCNSIHATEGSGSSSGPSVVVEARSEEPSLSVASRNVRLSSDGRTMPSERRYSRKGRGSGITRALGVMDRYLQTVNRRTSGSIATMQTLDTKSEKSSDICAAWKQVEKVIGLTGLTKVILPNQYLQQAWFGRLEATKSE